MKNLFVEIALKKWCGILFKVEDLNGVGPFFFSEVGKKEFRIGC